MVVNAGTSVISPIVPGLGFLADKLRPPAPPGEPDQVAKDLRNNSLLAMAMAVCLIFIYILLRFDFDMGYSLGAVAALTHDVIITVGVIILLDWYVEAVSIKIGPNVIGAILAVVGYSLNDTIVVFDRIRENRHGHVTDDFKELVNISLNQTLSRTIITSVTTLVAVGSLLILGGPVIQGLAVALAVGVMIGTYSSVFVAAPVLVDCNRYSARRAERQRQKR